MWRFTKKPRRRPSWLLIAVVAAVLIFAGGYEVRNWYNRSLGPVSSSSQTVYFTVASGSTVHEIAVQLKDANLIRSSRAFETYVRGKSLFGSLQAGTYALSPSMSTAEIVNKMVNGQIARNLLAILPGKTVTQIRQAFKQAGYSDAELDVAFNPSTYPDEAVLANLPSGAGLEGFLYPDS